MRHLRKFSTSRHYSYRKKYSESRLTRTTRVPSIGREILRKVRKCLSIEANRREFEAWYRERYGQDYVWKTISIGE